MICDSFGIFKCTILYYGNVVYCFYDIINKRVNGFLIYAKRGRVCFYGA